MFRFKLKKNKTANESSKIKQLSIYLVLNPILKFTTIIGMNTLKLQTSKSETIIKVNNGLRLYTIVLLIISICHFILIPHSIIQIDTKVRSSTLNTTSTAKIEINQALIAKLLSPIVVSIVSMICRTSSLLKLHNYLPDIMKKWTIVDKLIPEGIKMYKKDFRIVYFLIVCVTILSIPLQLFSINSVAENGLLVIIIFIISSMNNFVGTCSDLQFSSICFLLYERFKILNKRLSELDKIIHHEVQDTSEFKKVVLQTTIKKNIFKTGGNYYVNENGCFNRLVNVISNIHVAYKYLCKILYSLNKLYNIQLLVTTAGCVLNTLINAYFALFGGYVKSNYKTVNGTLALETRVLRPFVDALPSVFWTLYYFIRFCFVSSIASFTTQEAQRLCALSSSLQTSFLDEDTKEELSLLVSYSSSQQLDITACGFYNLNLSFIASALAAGITYLVIMVQFQGALS